jgi:hypothetical protein
MTEAEVRRAAEDRGWTLEKDGKVCRHVADSGTIVAGDWTKLDTDYFGMALAEVAEALEP